MANLSTITGNVLADSGTALTGLQPISASLTSISGLTYASTSFVKMSAAGTFALDTSTYTIGGVTGTGTTNYVPKFTSASVVGNSLIYDNGTNVGIGTTTPAYKLDVNGTGYFSGSVTATNFILSSDRNLKDNIAPISTESLNINYKSFNLKSDPNQLRYGVIAQEVEVDYPELVYTDKEGVKSVAYIDLLIREIAALKERIIILEAK
jgi:Chaperone of endosialidase